MKEKMEKEQLIVINQVSDIEALGEYLADKDFVAYDSETTGLHKEAEIIGVSLCAEETKAYYIVLAFWDSSTNQLKYLTDNYEATKKILSQLKAKSLIMHNGVFDCQMAENYFKISLIESLHTDTMILAHLLDENRRVGLKELAKEYFGSDSIEEAALLKESVVKNGGSVTKADYQMYKADPLLMGKYGAKDALLTYKLFFALVPELYEQKLDKFFYEDESMPLLKGPTYQLNTTGIRVDVQGMASLKKQLEAECLEAEAFIKKEIASHIQERYPGTSVKTTFNINSSQHKAWLCFGKLGLEFGVLTKEGKTVCKALGLKLPYFFSAKKQFIEECLLRVGQVYQPEAIVNGTKTRGKKIKEPWCYITTDKKTLSKYAEDYKWIGRLLEYQRKMKIIGTYITGIEERIEYGVIYPSFLQHGTTSGRFSSRNPNLQNLPRDDQRVKECFISRPGKVFVSADYSQLEPRVFSYVSKDVNLMAAFKSKEDFYSVIGIRVYGKHDATPYKDGSHDAFGVKYKKLRDLAKVIALATVYGATPHQLAPTTGKSIEDTAEDISEYLEQFPGVAKMMTDSHELAKSKGIVWNEFGRPRRILEAKRIKKLYGNASHAELPYEARKLLNLACNHRIQSTAASIVNRAAIRFYNDCKDLSINCRIVSQIHDELVIECDEQDATDCSILLQNAMENTTILEGVDLEAIPRITKNLAK